MATARDRVTASGIPSCSPTRVAAGELAANAQVWKVLLDKAARRGPV